jgi:hypothetical protein
VMSDARKRRSPLGQLSYPTVLYQFTQSSHDAINCSRRGIS